MNDLHVILYLMERVTVILSVFLPLFTVLSSISAYNGIQVCISEYRKASKATERHPEQQNGTHNGENAVSQSHLLHGGTSTCFDHFTSKQNIRHRRRSIESLFHNSCSCANICLRFLRTHAVRCVRPKQNRLFDKENGQERSLLRRILAVRKVSYSLKPPSRHTSVVQTKKYQ